LAAGYGTEGDDLDARAAAQNAYNLRGTTSRWIQISITASHIRWNTQDLYESLRNDQNWTALYPNSPQAWDRLSTVQRDLAQYPEAVASSKRAVALQPLVMAYDTNLATGQIQSGALKDARATLEQALAHKIDSDSLRTRYLELSYVLHDVSLQRQQYAWAEAHPDAATVVLVEARIAIAEGRFSDAQTLVARNREICQQQGVRAAGEQNTKSEAVDLMEAGAIEAGKKMFLSVPVDADEGLDAIGLVYTGDVPAAKAALHAMQTKYPHGTLWNLYWGPQILASIAMVDHKPQDAAAILETARPIEMRELVIPWLRGTAYLAAGEPDRAEKDFREVIAHPEADPTSTDIALSWLGLARALTAQDKRPAAIDAYRHFLALWAHADPDALYLKRAKQEFAKLQVIPLAQ
jgi:tetratricopeptide (TPR) repeat protein